MKKLLAAVWFFLVMGLVFAGSAQAEEVEFGGVHFKVPEGARVTDSKTFAGSTPSRAWIMESDGSEVVTSAIVTEGVAGGLDVFATTVLVKLYLEGFVVGWRVRIKGNPEGELAIYCGGQPGYHLEATFGNEGFDYYACMKIRDDKGIAATVVTWIQRKPESKDPEGEALVLATKRLKPYLDGIYLEPYQPM